MDILTRYGQAQLYYEYKSERIDEKHIRDQIVKQENEIYNMSQNELVLSK